MVWAITSTSELQSLMPPQTDLPLNQCMSQSLLLMVHLTWETQFSRLEPLQPSFRNFTLRMNSSSHLWRDFTLRTSLPCCTMILLVWALSSSSLCKSGDSVSLTFPVSSTLTTPSSSSPLLNNTNFLNYTLTHSGQLASFRAVTHSCNSKCPLKALLMVCKCQ